MANSVTLICIAVIIVVTAVYWDDIQVFVSKRSAKNALDVSGVSIMDSGQISFSRNGREVLIGQFGVNFKSRPTSCSGLQSCLEWSEAVLKIEEEVQNGIVCHHVNWKARTDTPLEDCFGMDPAHWYGGGEVYHQHWPVEKWNIPMTSFTSGDLCLDEEGKRGFGSVIEPYWLSSAGVAIRVERDVPLHVGIENHKLCFKSMYQNSKYWGEDSYPGLNYSVCIGNHVRDIHDFMTRRFFPVPSGLPDERMFLLPIWSTWAQYKVFINETAVVEYSNNIRKHHFKDSQIEIDDGYQVAHGDFDFDPKKFKDAKKMVDLLHENGFRVTMWVHPFANPDSQAYIEGTEKGYFVVNSEGGNDLVSWWNGKGAYLDPTNPEAREWYIKKLKNLQEKYGIDSFKFDAGEVRFMNKGYKTHEPLINPGDYTTQYVNTVTQLGTQIEVRAAYKNHNVPIFIRAMDKESVWGWDNGLKTVLTTSLTFGMIGYPFILPDMIGGNAYDSQNFHSIILPERELFIRWLQLTAFLPSMQYSLSPWQYDDEVVRIAQKWTSFHEKVLAPKMIQIAKEETLRNGSPIIRPVWWIAPTDKVALEIDSEFLVGDDILVAPILDKGARKRDVYLPKGQWINELTHEALDGGRWYSNILVPLEDILYFTLNK